MKLKHAINHIPRKTKPISQVQLILLLTQRRKSQRLKVESQQIKRLVKKDHIKEATKSMRNYIKIVAEITQETNQNQQMIKHTLKQDVKNKKFQI